MAWMECFGINFIHFFFYFVTVFIRFESFILSETGMVYEDSTYTEKNISVQNHFDFSDLYIVWILPFLSVCYTLKYSR